MRTAILSTVALLALGACGGTTGGGGGGGSTIPNLPDIQDGTVAPGDRLYNTSGYHSAVIPMPTTNGSSSSSVTKSVKLGIDATDSCTIYFQVDGETYTLNGSPAAWTGSKNGNTITIRQEAVAASSSPAGLAEIQYQTSSGSTHWGYQLFGLTPPAGTIDAHTGSATFAQAHGAAIVVSDGSGGTTFGDGSVTLNVTFTTGGGTVSGTLTFDTITGNGTINSSASITGGSITGNTFDGTLTFANAADLNLSSVNTATIDGKFFGLDGTSSKPIAAGGTFNTTGDGGTAFIQGGFVATCLPSNC